MSVININGEDRIVGEEIILYTNNFVVSGVIAGSVKVKVIPGILLDGIDNSEPYYLLNGLSREYTFKSTYKTKLITMTEKPENLSFRTSSEFSLNMERYTDESLLIMLNNRLFMEISIEDIIINTVFINFTV